VTVPQNNVARVAHANQSYCDNRKKVANTGSQHFRCARARAGACDENCNSRRRYRPIFRNPTKARSTCRRRRRGRQPWIKQILQGGSTATLATTKRTVGKVGGEVGGSQGEVRTANLQVDGNPATPDPQGPSVTQTESQSQDSDNSECSSVRPRDPPCGGTEGAHSTPLRIHCHPTAPRGRQR